MANSLQVCVRGSPLRQLAYVLATAYHEIGTTMQPVGEALVQSPEKLTLASSMPPSQLSC